MKKRWFLLVLACTAGVIMCVQKQWELSNVSVVDVAGPCVLQVREGTGCHIYAVGAHEALEGVRVWQHESTVSVEIPSDGDGVVELFVEVNWLQAVYAHAGVAAALILRSDRSDRSLRLWVDSTCSVQALGPIEHLIVHSPFDMACADTPTLVQAADYPLCGMVNIHPGCVLAE